MTERKSKKQREGPATDPLFSAETIQELMEAIDGADPAVRLGLLHRLMGAELEAIFAEAEADPLVSVAMIEHFGQGLMGLRELLLAAVDEDDPRLIGDGAERGIVMGIKDGHITALTPDEIPDEVLKEMLPSKPDRSTFGYL